MNDTELQQIATSICARWHRHPYHDDLLQIALLAAHQNQNLPNSWIGQRCKIAVIDELRRWCGRRGTARYQAEHVGFDEALDLTVDDYLNPAVELGLTGRHYLIATRLAAGYTKRQIAAELGVHPSRISHHLTEIRAALEDTA